MHNLFYMLTLLQQPFSQVICFLHFISVLISKNTAESLWGKLLLSKSWRMELFSCWRLWNRRRTLTKAKKFRIHVQSRPSIKKKENKLVQPILNLSMSFDWSSSSKSFASCFNNTTWTGRNAKRGKCDVLSLVCESGRLGWCLCSAHPLSFSIPFLCDWYNSAQ